MADAETNQADPRPAVIDAIDAAFEPLRRLAASPQPMNTAQLGTVVAAFRQALSVLVYGPPPAHETVVEDPNAVAAESLVPGNSEPQFPRTTAEEPQPEADAAEPQTIF